MTHDTVISADSLTQVFSIYPRPIDMLLEALTGRPRHHACRALDGVSFAVRRGEAVGVMGRNGAGKSTLLKTIAGILTPTAGSVTVAGRVAAILELGSGFHGDYSGRENVLLGGMCMGMSRAEVTRKFERIVEFSELSAVMDHPFRTYSTGMQARLTFSTAIAVDPDVLIVDEALAVGDARFQRKCYDRLRELRAAGTTILLVSHDFTAINAFCDRALLLENGRLLHDDVPRTISQLYHRMLFGEGSPPGPLAEDQLVERAREGLQAAPLVTAEGGMRYGSRDARILELGIRDEEDRPQSYLTAGKRYTVVLTAVALTDIDDLAVGWLVRDPRGVDVYGTDSVLQEVVIPPQKRGDVLECRLEFTNWLAPGEYFLTGSLPRRDGRSVDHMYDGMQFTVAPDRALYHASRANLDASISIRARGAVGDGPARPG